MKEWKAKLGVKVCAYCLMANHVHLVLDPGEDVSSIGKLMKRLAGRQTRYVNHLEKRTGSLWEGRDKSSPIQKDTYLLACSHYVEMNPVRAEMVDRPEDYLWSSYLQKIGQVEKWVDEDKCFLGLSDNEQERQTRYRQFVLQTNTANMDEVIRTAHRREWLTGNNYFIDEIERRVGVRIENRKQGRPK